jgi:ABC-type nickel/cobalt efflux system permease component RcnA
MSTGHGEKYFSKLLTGFGFVSGSVFLILYVCFEQPIKQDWYYWGILASVLFNIGLYLMVSAAVHKMKNDMIRRQKKSEQQKTFTSDT